MPQIIEDQFIAVSGAEMFNSLMNRLEKFEVHCDLESCEIKSKDYSKVAAKIINSKYYINKRFEHMV